ncbi:MAG: hypothetical protein Tsb009_34530 [Planctomycetaceae bacterium]
MKKKDSAIRNDFLLTPSHLSECGFSDSAMRLFADAIRRIVTRGMTGLLPSSILLWAIIRWEYTSEDELLRRCVSDYGQFYVDVEESLKPYSEKLVSFMDFASLSNVVVTSQEVAQIQGYPRHVVPHYVVIAIASSDDVGGEILNRYGATRKKLLAMSRIIYEEMRSN